MPFAIFRQTLFSIFFVAISLPFLWIVHRLLDLGSPPLPGVLLLGGGVFFACLTGGILGWGLGEYKRGESWIIWPAFLIGLMWGGVLCAILAPMYAQSVLDALARETAVAAWSQRDAFLDRQTGVATALETAKSLARSGATHLPAFCLLLWVLIGPALGGVMEARRAASR